ncbi:MAG: MBL fold metallo-hydrolase [Crocinitomicaceae bacterium]|nr:MBL fold metallo-hydrolase [Crocinitomicaceae bacterium]
MKIEQLYTGCLAEAAYYIENNGEVAIIDPLRETEPYIKRAEENDAKIKYIFETHFHADFVSGHLDLAKKTGAQIIYGPTAKPDYEITVAEDGQVFKLGNVSLKLIHTPGHTLESSSILLIDEEGNDHAIFTGDALFIGDVGRPDLAVKSDLSKEDLAGMLFDSLRNKIMPLGDDVLVYPNHGAGSACGKNMSEETYDSLGHQKKTNYALRADMSKEEFIKEVTDGILPPPQYFPKNAVINKSGYQSIDDVIEKGNVAFNVDTFLAIVEAEDALVLDTRSEDEFSKEHIPGSIFAGLNGQMAMWVGALITDINQPIVFIADEGTEQEVITRLARVGYDNSLGYLKGGLDAWKAAGKETDSINSVTAEGLKVILETEKVNVLDVRKTTEYEAEHVEDAINVPLDYINSMMDKIDPEKTYYTHCLGGYRSVIFNSIQKARGRHKLIDVKGGSKAMLEAGISMTDYVCPSTK